MEPDRRNAKALEERTNIKMMKMAFCMQSDVQWSHVLSYVSLEIIGIPRIPVAIPKGLVYAGTRKKHTTHAICPQRGHSLQTAFIFN